MSDDKDLFDELRRLILESDRENYAQQNKEILKKLDDLEKELNDPEKFAEVIQQSKAEIIDVLGPVMGKMIKKYISTEINKLKENIEKKRKALFSFARFKEKVKNKYSNVSEADSAINNATGCTLKQIFVIEKNSGILIGEYSHDEILEPDMVVGMLSAIKAFVENAFGKKNSELESLEYSSYKILLYNFNRFYYACVMDGYVDEETKADLQDQFLNITDEGLGAIPLKDIDDTLKKKVHKILEQTFSDKYLSYITPNEK